MNSVRNRVKEYVIGDPICTYLTFDHNQKAGELWLRRFYRCAPGMGNDLAVKVRYRLGSRNC